VREEVQMTVETILSEGYTDLTSFGNGLRTVVQNFVRKPAVFNCFHHSLKPLGTFNSRS
jgi:hypothetical protein